ncbi:MAG: TonB-dependent receptor [Sphingomonas sp.]|uniref:TonB-dependent receptor n=1 Tax=Sphingomonas sp. TaxID=28214 RepID=UPI001AC952C3|nr:TonB-dependent receptor [Sphingomonas sp.]MBN8816340.1 TonB-dependent receptor [Sphingomonas sp.]
MLALAVAGGALLAGGVAHAQTASRSNDSATEVGDIIVTAQKREEKLNNVGIAVAVLGADRLEKAGFSDPSDLSRIVPGFTYADSSLNTPIYTLRGIGFSDTSLAASSTVSVYEDEVAYPFPITTKGAAFDLERVEVVKGPQGTLYGQNTTAGAINYIAHKPTDTFSAGVDLGFGRFNHLEAGGFVSGPLTEQIRARLALKSDTADGWQVSQTRPGDRNGKVRKLTGRLIVDADLSAALRVSLTAEGWSDHGQTQAPQLRALDIEFPGNADPALLATPIPPRDPRIADWSTNLDRLKHDEFGQLAGRIDWDLSDKITITSLTAYSHFKTRASNEYDATAVNIFSNTTGGKISSFSQELRLAGESDIVKWVVGGNYSHSDTHDTNEVVGANTSANRPPAGTTVKSANNFADQKISAIAAFASADWHLTDTLSLTTGARYTSFKADFRGCAGDSGDNTLSPIIQFVSNSVRSGAGLPLLPNSAFTPGIFQTGTCTTFVNPNGNASLTATPGLTIAELKEHNVSWRGALDWKPMPDTLLYVSVSQGYKSGSFPTLPSTSYTQYDPARQEKVLAYEVGAKAKLFDRRVQLNVAGFYYDYRDKQLRGFFRDPIFATLSRLTNVPKSHLYGIEADLSAVPVRGLAVTASGSYIKTRIDDYIGLDSKGVVTNYAGRILSYSPEWQFNADAEYGWALTGKINAFVGGSYAYRSSASAVFGEDPRLTIDAYNTLDLRAGIENKQAGWRVLVYADNVTNEYYVNNLVPLYDTIKAYAGMPVTYGVRLHYAY